MVKSASDRRLCPKCGIAKNLDEFVPDRAICYACQAYQMRLYRETNAKKERQATYARKAAIQRLIDLHPADFDEFYDEERKLRGLRRIPRGKRRAYKSTRRTKGIDA
jgi:hypothetical protein